MENLQFFGFFFLLVSCTRNLTRALLEILDATLFFSLRLPNTRYNIHSHFVLALWERSGQQVPYILLRTTVLIVSMLSAVVVASWIYIPRKDSTHVCLHNQVPPSTASVLISTNYGRNSQLAPGRSIQGSSQKKFKAGWWFKDKIIVVVLLHSYDHIKHLMCMMFFLDWASFNLPTSRERSTHHHLLKTSHSQLIFKKSIKSLQCPLQKELTLTSQLHVQHTV